MGIPTVTTSCGLDYQVFVALPSIAVGGENCPGQVYKIIYTVEDECGNELTGQTYSHSGSDQTLPSLTGTAYTDATDYDACVVDAESTVPAWSEANAIMGYSDNCGAAVTAVLTDTQTSGDDCSWSVTDT